MKKLVFYKCKHCGNVVIKLVDSVVPLVCCGSQMEVLNANTTDAAVEKHMPVVSVADSVVKVVVGEVLHPMSTEHQISFIVLETSNGYHIKELLPTDTPTAEFAFLSDEKCIAVYEYCNLHGLWVYNF